MYWVAKGVHVGGVWKPLYRLLKGAPIYMVCAISVMGVLIYALSDKPFTITLFNSFLLRLIELIPSYGASRFMLIDNASFHAIDLHVRELMDEVMLGVTHTAPSTCALDPIEEFFGATQTRVARKYEAIASQMNQIVSLTRSQFKQLICEAVDEVGASDM